MRAPRGRDDSAVLAAVTIIAVGWIDEVPRTLVFSVVGPVGESSSTR